MGEVGLAIGLGLIFLGWIAFAAVWVWKDRKEEKCREKTNLKKLWE